MSSLRNTDPHCLQKDDALLDTDSALPKCCNAAQSQDIMHGSEHQKPQDRGRGGKGRGRGGIEFITQKPDYDGGSLKKLLLRETEVGELAHKSLKMWF